ncbi:MAG: hypothetical protein BWY06_01117 [Candidatus Latescibacteria bacterium ADurb.Bin168]|nr:MAG: hypothetical protein BWY06_01117 [Candidatus Latescibacteria bacterium ADurb.Bin168]
MIVAIGDSQYSPADLTDVHPGKNAFFNDPS